ncbi:MAG TPA: alpha/beta hydrolase [Gaiella sp.]|nr:alpha/beta hydrolase [Gaiella sp.]
MTRTGAVEALGLRVYVREGGAGEPVLFVHGIGVSGRYFEPLARRLARTHRVVVPDLPGWGRSERPRQALTLDEAADVLAVLLELERGSPAVVGNSLGCQIALRLVERHPALVGRLVMIGPTVDPRYRGWIVHAARLLLDAAREPPALWRIAFVDYLRMGARRLLVTARAALEDRPERRLPALEAPLLVVRGERDAIVTRAWARRLAELAPRGRSLEVRGAAHAAHVSHPAEVAVLVESFLAERGDQGA